MATSTVIFFLGLVGLMVLGQLQRLELPPWPAFYLHDLLLASWAGWLLVKNWQSFIKTAKKVLTGRVNIWKNWPLEWSLVGWLILGWLVAIGGGVFSLTALLYTARFLTYGLIFFWLGRTRTLPAPLARWGAVVIGGCGLVWGLGQYWLLPDMRFLSINGWDDHYYRLLGTQFDPNFMGLILVLFFVHLQRLKIKPQWQVIILGLKILTLLGLALTFSRSAWLSFGVAQILLAGTKWKRYWPALVLLFFIWLMPKPGGEGVVLSRTASIEARALTAKQTLVELSGWQWLVGRGLFNTPKASYVLGDYQRADHAGLPDNLLLLVLNSGGVVGLILVAALSIRWGQKFYRTSPAGLIFVLAVVTHSLFNNSLFQPFIFIFLSLSLISEIDG